MENRSHALIAGLFTLLLGVAAVAALWWFGGTREEITRYVVVTDGNVTGLNLQAQVRYRGIRVGKVDSIELDPKDPGKTLIGIGIGKATPVTRGTTARLGYQGVTGIAHVLLEDQGTSPEPLPTTRRAPGRIVMQDSLIERLTDTGGDTLRNARDLLASINGILTDENRQAISRTLVDLQVTTGNARAMTEQLRRLISAENVARMTSTLAHVERTVAEAGPLLAETRGLAMRLQGVSERLDTAVGGPWSGGVAALAPRLNQLTWQLSANSQQLGRVLQMLEESPQSLIFGRRDLLPGPGEAGFVAPIDQREQP